MSSINTPGLLYSHANDSGHSFQQPSIHMGDAPKTSSYTDLLDLQTQLESQKMLREKTSSLLKAIESDIAHGKYSKDRQRRRTKRLEAQTELNSINRNIMTLERKVEAFKRIHAQEASHSNNINSSFSYLKGNSNASTPGFNKTLEDAGLFLPPHNIHNITFASAHSSSNSTPVLSDEHDEQARFDDDTILQRFEGDDADENYNITQNSYSTANVSSNEHAVSEGSTTWILSDLLQFLGQRNEEEEFYIQKSNQLVDLLKNNHELINNLVFSTVGHRIQCLLLNLSKEVIACGYRIARYVITDTDSLIAVKSLRLHFFLIHSLSKTTEFTVEREQAIKLIRHYLNIEGGHNQLSVGVVKTLASIVNSAPDDELKDLITETLCEILLLNAKLVYEANGIKAIIKMLNDGPSDMAAMCGLILVKVLDLPESRKYLRNGEELRLIIHYFVNNFANVPEQPSEYELLNRKSTAVNKPHLNIEKLHNSAFMISSFLKTWVGISAFAVDNFEMLRNLIASLSYEIPILRDILMDIFFDILRIRPLPWLTSSNTNKRASQIAINQPTQLQYTPGLNQPTIVNHYTAITLSIFLKCGLAESVAIITQTSKDDINRRKSLFLLTEMYNYAVNLLPPHMWLPYFELSLLIPDDGNRGCLRNSSSQTAAFQIEKITRKLYKNRTTYNVSPAIFEPYTKMAENMASVITSNIDDIQLRKMIDETRVLFTKRFIDWKWDIILEIIKGPLRIPKKFEDCLKYQVKFMKKMMSFYRPFKRKFLLIKKTKNYQKYINTGVALFETLLSHKEGIHYLSENKLLPQIAECLAQVDPVSGLYAENPIFSKTNLQTTLSSGYFKMLGVLSKSPVGLSFLRKWKIFSILHHIVNERGREDLILTFLPEFDVNLPSQLRVIFSHALTSCDTSVRLYATEHLATILKASKSKQCSKWAFNLLINQLYDPDMEVCNVAVQILDTYCVEPENITEAVKYRPSLDQLGNIGAPLLLRFLSTALGFNYLLEIDFIEKEMQDWFTRKNDLYVIKIENMLNDEYKPFRKDLFSHETRKINPTADEIKQTFYLDRKRNMLPHHFYGELVKTPSGISLLQSTNHLQAFVDIIKELKTESRSDYKILKLKGCLWAVGHIGSSELAIEMVDESGVVQDIIELCRTTEVWSVKGTAFFVLGLLSNTQEGLEILDEFNWDVAIDVNNNPTSFCIPKNLSDYFHVHSVASRDIVDYGIALVDSLPALSALSSSSSLRTDSEMEEEENSVAHRMAVCRDTTEMTLSNSIDSKIIQYISNFGITTSGSIKQLKKLESKYKERFSSPDLYLSVMYMLENYSYKYSARMFILQLFSDKRALENVTKRDRIKTRRIA